MTRKEAETMPDKAQPTPGPWALRALGRRPGNEFYQQVGTKDWGVGEVRWSGDRPDDKAVQMANARLIAAAPDLLEAARFAEERFGMWSGKTAAQEYALDKLREAIAKATGA